MGTVLVLNPMGTDVTYFMPYLLKGTVSAGHNVVTIPYTNQPGYDNIEEGNELYNTARMAIPDDEYGGTFAYSEGCQVYSLWSNTYGASTPDDPKYRPALLIGHAANKYGGFIYEHEIFSSVGYIHGVNEDTDYPTQIFTRQYDSIGDFPTGSSTIQNAFLDLVSIGTDLNYLTTAMTGIKKIINTPYESYAVQNAILGAALVHNWYFDVTPGDKANLRHKEGNIEYILSPTYPLPMIGGYWWLPEYMKSEDKRIRPMIETTYDRPYDDMKPPYINTVQHFSAFPQYKPWEGQSGHQRRWEYMRGLRSMDY